MKGKKKENKTGKMSQITIFKDIQTKIEAKIKRKNKGRETYRSNQQPHDFQSNNNEKKNTYT